MFRGTLRIPRPYFIASALCTLLLTSLLCDACEILRRNQEYAACDVDYQGTVKVLPSMHSLSPNYGPVEGGISLTVTGSDFLSFPQLHVTFVSMASDETKITSTLATFIDLSTIVVLSPPRDAAHVARVYVSADGLKCLESSDLGEVPAYLEFTYVHLAPSGVWQLLNPSLASQGGEVGFLQRAMMENGNNQGVMYHGRKELHFASGLSMRRSFSHFTETVFYPARGRTTSPADRTLQVTLYEPSNYESAVQSDFTYEITAKNTSGQGVQWTWRKWPSGTQSFGTYSELHSFSTGPVQIEHGIAISFTTLSGKNDGDMWKFDAITRNPFRVRSEASFDESMICHLPPPDVIHPDADRNHGGVQHEIKVSANGGGCFTKPRYRPRLASNNPVLIIDSNANQPAMIDVDGYFSAPEDYTFDFIISSPTSLRWRRYRPGMSSCNLCLDGPWCRYAMISNADFERGVYLEHGIHVKIATRATKRSGDRWEFTAFACWSTSFSPVKFRGKQLTSNDDALLYVEGNFKGMEDMTFEVEVLADHGMFRWRSYVQASNSSLVPWTDRAHMISTSPIYLESGISIHWLTADGKHCGDRWNWTAFPGLLVTTLAKPHVSRIMPSNINVHGDPGMPYVFGTYLGHEHVRIVIEIGGNCSTACSQFRWKKEYTSQYISHHVIDTQEAEFSQLYEMNDLLLLTDGVYISWTVAIGYVHGNAYTVTLSQVPTSFLPIQPTPSSPFSVFVNDEIGMMPAQHSVFTIEFWNSSAFKWRKDTGQYSKLMSPIINRAVHLTGGIGISLSSKNGYTPGVHHRIPLRTHYPYVFNVTTEHQGVRMRGSVSRPKASLLNQLNGPNYGSIIGDVIPQTAHTGPLHTDGHPAGKFLSEQNNVVTKSNCYSGKPLVTEITASATKGYVVDRYPVVYLKILGFPSLSDVLGEHKDEIEILGKYSGISSYVYEIESYGAGDHFTWRKYPRQSNNADGVPWSPADVIRVSSSSRLDQNLSVSFKSASFPASSRVRWTFTAHQGHTFVFRISGRATWSEEKIITGKPQELASGISVQFSKLSGYSSGDQFMIFNRTVDCFGAYVGEEDAEFTVQVAGDTEYDPPVFHPSSLGNTSGLPAKMIITGVYTGPSTYVYEILIVEGIHVGVPLFTWRKYALGHRDGGGPYDHCRKVLSLSPVKLDAGIFISWATISGQSKGDIWRFTAHAGDTFHWRRQGSEWSPLYRISNVGIVVPDQNNTNSHNHEHSIRVVGEYEGSTEATFVVEILLNGDAFRWKKHTDPPDYDSIATKLSSSIDLKNAMLDSDPVVEKQTEYADSYGKWSPAMSIALMSPIHLMDGVHIIFTGIINGNAHGDLFYIPVKTSRHHRLEMGIYIAFGSGSGYSPGDQWHFKARAPIAARGPLKGNTEMVIRGSGFLSSPALRCKLSDPRTMHTMIIPAHHISHTELRCITKLHPADIITDPKPNGFGNRVLYAHGTYRSLRSAIIDLRLNSSTDFQWRVRDIDSTHVLEHWSKPKYISPGSILPIYSGIAIRFSRSQEYLMGDSWTLSAYGTERSSLAKYYRGVPDDSSVRPGIMKYVSISLDGGSTWSADQHGLTRFLFSDIHISEFGDDNGDGTYSTPYKSLQHGISAALSPLEYVSVSRPSFTNDLLPFVIPKIGLLYLTIFPPRRSPARTYLRRDHINVDTIIVHPGRYMGMGNSAIFVVRDVFSYSTLGLIRPSPLHSPIFPTFLSGW